LSGTDFADIIADSLKNSSSEKGKIVLVAHSASGLFLPLVPAECRVSRLVFLAAAIPQIGKSFRQQLQADPEMLWPDWIGEDPTKDDAVALHYLFHDCPSAVAEWALTTLHRTHLDRAMTEVCPIDQWPNVPSSFIVCREDRTCRPQWCRQAARERLGVTPIELPGGHCPHVSRPKELAAVLDGLVTLE
jgi:pimeloyl-ACP methyl ester carboxylesterase